MGRTGKKTAKRAFGLRGETDGERQCFVLWPGENRVGTNASNDIVLAASGVSREHAVLTCSGTALRVRDRDSKNGTFLNGKRIVAAELKPGDILQFGSVSFVVEQLDAADAAPVTPPSVAGRSAPIGAAREAAGQRSTTPNDNVPACWFAALADILAIGDGGSRGDEGADEGRVLDRLVTRLKATGAGLVEWSRSGGVTVRRWSGTLQAPSNLPPRLSEVLSSQEGPTAYATSEDPPLTVVATTAGGERLALFVLGDFPRRESAGTFLSSILTCFTGQQASRRAQVSSSMQRGLAELVFPDDHIPGSSRPMRTLYLELRHLVTSDLPILITGETGSGKEHIARIVHLSSPRAVAPFEAVNCPAIPTDLLEAELFGIEAGVATGVKERRGKMPLADGGVVFLDEIAEMPPALQAKLLRALQEREIYPIGARRPVRINVRIVAATNTDLVDLVAQGRFRQDLFFRIAGYMLRVPPLRERREEIPELADRLMRRFATEAGKVVRGFSARALDALVEAPWPGNVRELENELRRAVMLCPSGQPITSTLLSERVLAPLPPREGIETVNDLHIGRHVAELETRLIKLALARTGGKRTRAAELLGLTRQGLRLKMTKLRLED